MRTLQRWLETAFETFLFNSRLVVILAVVGSLTSSVLMFVRGVIVIWHTAKDFLHHFGDAHGEGEELSIALISSVDSFLFATVLLIFAMGIYELFISKIDPASRTEESRPNWLQIHSLDDLKSAVGKVILMILIVRLFESAVKMKYDTPLHLLYLGLSVLFVAGALFLQHASHKHDKHPEKYKSDHPSQKSLVPHEPAPHQAHQAHQAHHALEPHAPSHSIPVLTTARHGQTSHAPAPHAHPHHGPHPAMPPAYAAQHGAPMPVQPMQPYPTLAPPVPQHPDQQVWDRASQMPFPTSPTAPRAY